MLAWDLTRVLFWLLATGIIGSALTVVLTQRPVIGVLSLISCFVQASIIWMLLGAEFLSLGLIFVYVGAVMTLFLFVVMMLNQTKVDELNNRNRVLLLGVMIFALLAFGLYKAWMPLSSVVQASYVITAPNVNVLGTSLYTKYLLSFEITALILLVAMLAAITLVFRGKKSDNKHQVVAEQVKVQAKDRFELKDLRSKK